MSGADQRQPDERALRKSLHTGKKGFRRVYASDAGNGARAQHHKPESALAYISAHLREREEHHVAGDDLQPSGGAAHRTRQNGVRADITIPVSVAYTDANGTEGAATSSVTITQDVILCIPSPSIMPYTVEAVVSLVSTKGTYTGTNQFTVDACVTIILKVVMEVELLIPSYGYSAIPPCQEYTQEVCAGFFELPVFPQ